MLAYSAIKINANPPLLYSVLNPDTSSDSPSAKSNGVRLVSAKHEANHTSDKGKVNHKSHTSRWYKLNKFKSNPPTKNTNDNKIKANLTS